MANVESDNVASKLSVWYYLRTFSVGGAVDNQTSVLNK